MKITKYRKVAIMYPWLSLECEVIDEDNTYYANITVNNEGESEEFCTENCWCYRKPMDQIGYDENGNELDYDEDYSNSICDDVDWEIYHQMYDFWNNNPVFDNDNNWKEWQ